MLQAPDTGESSPICHHMVPIFGPILRGGVSPWLRGHRVAPINLLHATPVRGGQALVGGEHPCNRFTCHAVGFDRSVPPSPLPPVAAPFSASVFRDADRPTARSPVIGAGRDSRPTRTPFTDSARRGPDRGRHPPALNGVGRTATGLAAGVRQVPGSRWCGARVPGSGGGHSASVSRSQYGVADRDYSPPGAAMR